MCLFNPSSDVEGKTLKEWNRGFIKWTEVPCFYITFFFYSKSTDTNSPNTAKSISAINSRCTAVPSVQTANGTSAHKH